MENNAADKDFGVICICALRYAMGRRTYIPSLVQDIVRRNFANIPTCNLETMAKDIADAPYYGDDIIDKPDWIRFKTDVDNEINKRILKGG